MCCLLGRLCCRTKEVMIKQLEESGPKSSKTPGIVLQGVTGFGSSIALLSTWVISRAVGIRTSKPAKNHGVVFWWAHCPPVSGFSPQSAKLLCRHFPAIGVDRQSFSAGSVSATTLCHQRQEVH